MRVTVIWIVWLALVLWWLTPELNHVKDKINERSTQIERTLNE
jgi:hypothetical protein